MCDLRLFMADDMFTLTAMYANVVIHIQHDDHLSTWLLFSKCGKKNIHILVHTPTYLPRGIQISMVESVWAEMSINMPKSKFARRYTDAVNKISHRTFTNCEHFEHVESTCCI